VKNFYLQCGSCLAMKRDGMKARLGKYITDANIQRHPAQFAAPCDILRSKISAKQHSRIGSATL
jgi:hypothetical protein